MNRGEVFIYAGWNFPYYPFILLQNLRLKGTFREFGNADCRNPSWHNYVHFSRPVTEEKSAEQLAQICILWLIPGGSQITDSLWMFKKLNLCWEFSSVSIYWTVCSPECAGCNFGFSSAWVSAEFTYLHLQSHWSLGAAETRVWVETFPWGYLQYLLRAGVSWIILISENNYIQVIH